MLGPEEFYNTPYLDDIFYGVFYLWLFFLAIRFFATEGWRNNKK